MKIYDVIVKADYVSKYRFPLGKVQQIDPNDIIDYKEDKYMGPLEFYYEGNLTGDLILITIGLYACTKKFREELSKCRGVEFMDVILTDINTGEKNRRYSVFRPMRRIRGLVNENKSDIQILAKGKPYETKSYFKIVLDKKTISEVKEDMFKIPEMFFTIYIKDTLKPIFGRLEMFELVEVEVA